MCLTLAPPFYFKVLEKNPHHVIQAVTELDPQGLEVSDSEAIDAGCEVLGEAPGSTDTLDAILKVGRIFRYTPEN